MTPASLDLVAADLKRDEGFRNSLYYDQDGVPTCGYGTACREWSTRFAEAILRFKMNEDLDDLVEALPWFGRLDDVRCGVLLQMVYQLGLDGVLKFTETLRALEAGEYTVASLAMLQSAWARETPARSQRLADLMKTG